MEFKSWDVFYKEKKKETLPFPLAYFSFGLSLFLYKSFILNLLEL